MNEIATLAAALFDRYEITREIGAGGMATVYLARDLEHDRQVTVKVLRRRIAALPPATLAPLDRATDHCATLTE